MRRGKISVQESIIHEETLVAIRDRDSLERLVCEEEKLALLEQTSIGDHFGASFDLALHYSFPSSLVWLVIATPPLFCLHHAVVLAFFGG